MPLSLPQEASEVYEPCILSPVTEPVKLTVRPWPLTAPKSSLSPVIVPLTVPLVIHAAESLIVPLRVEPSWVKTTVNSPCVELNFLLTYVPAQVPTSLPSAAGAGAGVVVVVAVGAGALVLAVDADFGALLLFPPPHADNPKNNRMQMTADLVRMCRTYGRSAPDESVSVNADN